MNLIPKSTGHLERVGKSIELTNKLLQEIDNKITSIDDNYMVLIPDESFRNYLKDNHSISFDESYVSYYQIKQIREINTSGYFGYEIINLSGLQYFTSLEKLVVPSNNITKLDVRNNIKLSLIDCSNNPLNTIDLSKNLNLTHLDCYFSGISYLELSNNIHLQELICGMNPIEHLDISQNSQLLYLNCESTLLTNIDVSKNTSLTKLECSRNQLTNIDISKNSSLSKLDCAQNQLTNINISANIDLIYLECSDNNLIQLDVSKNMNLVVLSAARNELINLDLSQNNYLQKVELIGNPGDWWTKLEKNPFDFWNSLHDYWKLVMYANKLINDPKAERGFHPISYRDYIEYIFINNIDLNIISEIEIIEILNIEYFEFGCRQWNCNSIFSHLPENDPLIIELSSKYIEITDFSPLSYLRKLKKLDLNDSDIIDIKVLSNLVDLKELNLAYNKINDVSPLISLHKLEQLILNDNEIIDISPLSKLKQLMILDLSNNKITNISSILNLNYETIFIYINLEKNSITDISHLFKLPKDIILEEGIHLGGNPISDKDISDLIEHFTNDIISFEDPFW